MLGYEVMEQEYITKPVELDDWLNSLSDPRWEEIIKAFPVQDSEPSNTIIFDPKTCSTNVNCYAKASASTKRKHDLKDLMIHSSKKEKQSTDQDGSME